MIKTDIIIAGGGVAGLIATLAFAQDGHKIAVIDPKPIALSQDAKGADQRTAAYLQPAQALLEELGIWTSLQAGAMPLQIMRLVDAGGRDGAIRERVDFDASELGHLPFGWNIANWKMRATLAEALKAHPNITFFAGQSLTHLLARTAHIRATLDDGERLEAALIIGADGRDSFVREASNILFKTTSYGQSAIVFTVTHREPHQNISTEVHQSGGPFTLVPLPDLGGLHQSSVVWMDHNDRIAHWAALDDDAFSHAATTRSAGALGPLTLSSARQVWPIISRSVSTLTTTRTALIAEAAHVMPPIGAQGLNTSINDVIALKHAARSHPLGSDAMLAAYASARRSDIKMRSLGIEALNRAAMTDLQSFKYLRLKGLQTLYGLKPLRRQAMRMGLGVT